MSQLKAAIGSMALKYLPPSIYFGVADMLAPLANKARGGGPRRTVVRDGDTYRVSWPDGVQFHFIHAARYRRYAWPEGLSRVMTLMRDKYSNGHVGIRPGDIVIEAGANVGEFTRMAAANAKAVMAFEPDTTALAALRKNISALTNVEVHAAGLGDQDRTMTFFISTDDADSSIVEPETYTSSTQIEVRTVSNVMAERGLSRVGFLKVEAEGFEPEILRGCGARLKDIDQIAVDCSPERGGESPIEECDAMLKAAGFRTWRREAKGEIPLMLFALNVAAGG